MGRPMAQPFPIRRAAIYRHRANDIEQRQLPDTRDAVDRKHLLNLAETYRRTADAMARHQDKTDTGRSIAITRRRNDRGQD